jgi:hypothetical protein
MMEMNFLDRLKNFDKNSIPDHILKRLRNNYTVKTVILAFNCWTEKLGIKKFMPYGAELLIITLKLQNKWSLRSLD